MSDIALHVSTEDGKTHHVDVPPDIKTEEFLKELLEGIPPSDGNRQAADWSLHDKDTGRPLQPDKTLEENGVRAGQNLLLRERRSDVAICQYCGFENALGGKFCRSCGKPFIPPSLSRDIRLYLSTESGGSHPIEVAEDISTRDFIAELISTTSLSVEEAKIEAGNWILDDKDTARTLDHGKSLADNGVVHGHHLYLRSHVPAQPPIKPDIDKPPAKPGKAPDKKDRKPPRPFPLWLKLALVLGAITALAMGGYFEFLPKFTRVALSPVEAGLLGKQQQQFTAKVSGKNPAVQWSLTPEVGNISPDGLYSAPPFVLSEQTVTVTARSQQDPTKSASATITLKPSTETVVHVNPPSATLGALGTAKFAAQVSGSPNTDVQWTVDPQIGSISQDGIYTAPASVPAQLTVKVIASSEAHPSASESAIVTLEPVVVTLKPTSSVLLVSASGSLLFSATVAGSSNRAVKWSLSGPGSVSRNGVYFPPPSVPKEQTAKVTAISIADSTKSATAIVTLKPVVQISLNFSTVVLGASQQLRFSASVIGSNNPAVRWSISGRGNMTQEGVYFAPPSVPAEETVKVTATSEADPTKSASIPISLRPVSVSLSPANAELKASETTKFSATVAYSSDITVRWSVSGRGNISQNGLYAAPASIPADQTVRITATSVADPTRFATALVTLKRYSGPQKGVLIWSGQIEKNGVIVIEGNKIVDSQGPSLSSLEGDMLPGVPVQVSIEAKDFAIEEAPGPSNGWNRLSLRSKKGKRGVVKITWMVVVP
ncbi:MAG TPA: EsaB/YukD family protein [Terriglobales bacterium]